MKKGAEIDEFFCFGKLKDLILRGVSQKKMWEGRGGWKTSCC